MVTKKARLSFKHFSLAVVFPVIIAFTLILGLMYIDEGNYKLDFLTEPRVIVFLFIMVIFMFFAQWFINTRLLVKQEGVIMRMFSAIIALPLGFIASIVVFLLAEIVIG